MRRPAASDLMGAAASRRWFPLPLVQWLWTWCVRCDRVVTRWHYRGCPCIAYEAKPGTPLGDFCARLTEEHGKDGRDG